MSVAFKLVSHSGASLRDCNFERKFNDTPWNLAYIIMIDMMVDAGVCTSRSHSR